MEKLKKRIKESGLKQKFIAKEVGINNSSHLTMMLNEIGSARMTPEMEDKINKLLDKYSALK